MNRHKQEKAAFGDFSMKEYTMVERGRLLDIHRQLLTTSEGRRTLNYRFGFCINEVNFQRYIDNSALGYRVVMRDSLDRICGWGEYFIEKNTCSAEFSRLLLPEYQGKGLGTMLARHLITECKSRHPKLRYIESVTRGDNAFAIGSLRKLLKDFSGWSKVDRQTQDVHFIFPLR